MSTRHRSAPRRARTTARTSWRRGSGGRREQQRRPGRARRVHEHLHRALVVVRAHEVGAAVAVHVGDGRARWARRRSRRLRRRRTCRAAPEPDARCGRRSRIGDRHVEDAVEIEVAERDRARILRRDGGSRRPQRAVRRLRAARRPCRAARGDHHVVVAVAVQVADGERRGPPARRPSRSCGQRAVGSSPSSTRSRRARTVRDRRGPEIPSRSRRRTRSPPGRGSRATGSRT
jgi:hypothetical protein